MSSILRLGFNKTATSQLLFKRTVNLRFSLQNSSACKRLFSNSIKRANQITSRAEQDLLIAQRAKRPISPHLTIYEPQLTWYLSSVHRLSNVALGATFYIFTLAFGISSLLGLGLTVDNLSKWYHEKFSPLTQSVTKAAFAYLFALQFTLSIRHFIWDFGKQLSMKGVYSTGYIAMAASAVLGTYLWL